MELNKQYKAEAYHSMEAELAARQEAQEKSEAEETKIWQMLKEPSSHPDTAKTTILPPMMTKWNKTSLI